jgi:hypothetical protein
VVPAAALTKPSSDPSFPSSIKGPALCGGPLCSIVSASSGLLETGGGKDTSDGEFCVISDERVPVGKSSANKSEGDLSKLPERRIGAPNGECRRKNADPRWGAASAATYCDFLSLDVQLLIGLSITFMQSNTCEAPTHSFTPGGHQQAVLLRCGAWRSFADRIRL